MLVAAARPGRLLGDRPERPPAERLQGLDRRVESWIEKRREPALNMRRFKARLQQIEGYETEIDHNDHEALRREVHSLRRALRQKGMTDELAIRAFAIIRHVTRAALDLTPHPEQLFGGWVMLNGGIAEMQTGEGKTLTAALPAITMALTGTPVHVITVNEYLVVRDAAKLEPLYKGFGLDVAAVTEQMNDDDRRRAYQADVVYGTNKQFVFDYLRDLQALDGERVGLKGQIRTLLGHSKANPVMRGLGYAIIDEADSVLVDDARVPLILAQQRPAEQTAATEAAVALSIARTLHDGVDFRVHPSNRQVRLTEIGHEAISDLASRLQGVWRFERYRLELIRQALTALHTYQVDRDYLINDGKIELIDESTGRLMSDRKLQHGLHRMLEVKESCQITEDSDVVASLSFQHFFNRYCNLAGMSGTVREVSSELSTVYRTSVVEVPPHRRCLRKTLPPQIVPDLTVQLGLTLKEVVKRTTAGQPLLIGTRTVAMSERVSEMLHAHQIPHALLNARQDAEEAEIVGRGGIPGAVTVATNMAGRGTDIPLQGDAAVHGGLHVINLEINESRRVDRQLSGRCARQGDPGSSQSIFSLKDELIQRELPASVLTLLEWFVSKKSTAGHWLARRLVRLAQQRCERRHSRERMLAFNSDERIKRQLEISGNKEVSG